MTSADLAAMREAAVRAEARREGYAQALKDVSKLQRSFGHAKGCKCAGCEALGRMLDRLEKEGGR